MRGIPASQRGNRRRPVRSACSTAAAAASPWMPSPCPTSRCSTSSPASARGRLSRKNGCRPASSSPARKNGMRAERVGADEDPALRPPERDLLPPAAAEHRQEPERRLRQRQRDDVERHAEPRGQRGAVAVVPVDQLDHAGRLAERADALLDAVAVDRIGQPDAAVDGERVRRAAHRSRLGPAERRPRARRRSGRSRRSRPAARTRARRPRSAGRRARAACGRAGRREPRSLRSKPPGGSSPRSGHGNGLPRAPPRRLRPAARARGPAAAARPGRRCPAASLQ